MKEIREITNRAADWLRQRQSLLVSFGKDPLIYLLGLRLRRRGESGWAVRLPWSRPQRLFYSEVPQSFLTAMAEVAVNIQKEQAQIYFPFEMEIFATESEFHTRLGEPVEVRFQPLWPEIERLRLELAKDKVLERTETMTFWSRNNRTVGTILLRLRLTQKSYLPA